MSAVTSAERVILELNQVDFDLMVSELLQVLLRAQDKFERPEFSDAKWRAVVAVMVKSPRIAF